MNRGSKIVRFVAVLLAVAAYAVLGWLFVRRLAYPYDLEWMEGGMLCHSLRLLHHQPIYAPPSLDFIPFLYTPLYPALLALLAKVTPGGLGYTMARTVSVASCIGALVIGWRFAARHGGSRAMATVAMAIPAAAFALTGAWYDLARPDTLWLLLCAAALLLLYRAARDDDGERRTDPRRHALVAAAAALFVAAFFTKQTASPLMIAGGVALLLLDWRLVPTYGLVLAGLGLPTLWWLDKASDGWFWTYVFRLHQSHEFYARRAFLETPWVLVKIVGPALFAIPWALTRRRTPGLLYATYLGLAGAAVSCVGFGTQWAFDNAYIPGVYFLAIAVGVAGGQLVAWRREAIPRLRPAVVFALLGLSLVLDRYDPRRFVPTVADRAAGDRLLGRLRATEGEVLIPFHPFYGHLAGKRTYLHRMGVLDITAAGLGPPRGLVEATHAHHWKLAIFDDKVASNWSYWPALLDEYRIAERIAGGPRTVSGAPTVPLFVLTPGAPSPDGLLY